MSAATLSAGGMKWGNSLGLRLPAHGVKALGLEAGANLELQVADGKLIATPAKPRYQLQTLLAQCDFSAPNAQEDAEWLDDGAQGLEAL